MFIRDVAEKNCEAFFNRIPGAIGLVSIGGEIANVPDYFIQIMRIKMERINGCNALVPDKLKKGDLIKIETGPFAGYEAIFDSRITGTDRVRIFLTMLQKRLLPIELSENSISLQKTI